ncbi:MAG: hypothetical protein IIA02_03390 [Proteobacteria bacterium]|uniref:hypothetical protein n=1 Tax=Aquabacterium sp. TaxID=1872578 RepID=UPI0035C6B30C|nr:hypothetical protein [Pseudomonadota bacterium]
MWKMLVGFIVFAVLAVYLLMKSGADVDMGGEKHGVDATHVEDSKAHEAPASAAPVASAASN